MPGTFRVAVADRIRRDETHLRRRLQKHYDDSFDQGRAPVSGPTIKEIDRFLDALPLQSHRIFSLGIDPYHSVGDRVNLGEMLLHSESSEYILVGKRKLHLFVIAWD